MKTIIKSLCLGTLMTLCSLPAFSWGQKGHDVTCAVAQKHLTKKAEKRLTELLDGKSIVYWSKWMDTASNTPEYAYTKTWHFKNIDADETYENAAVNENGDVLTAIESQIAALKSGTLNKEQSALAVKMLIHFVADLHCPMHMGHKSDKGGNTWQLQYFSKGYGLHKIWDTNIIESAHNWSYTEWVEEIDTVSKEEIKEIVKGKPDDWGRETYIIATEIYNTTPIGSKLSNDYDAKWIPTIEKRLLWGGLRLASILNDIFGR